MGFEPVAKALVLSLLLTSFMVNVFAAEEDILDEHRHGRHGPTASPTMAPGPSPSHHHHHHHKHHPPTQAPTKPPTHPPVKPPGHHPLKPPTSSPVKPPSHPPLKPPSHPPVKPVKPPTSSPVKPPSHPPVKPPTHPPVKPPSHPPVKPPSYPPVKPPTKAPSPLPPRKLVAVQGVVYCKPCKYRGVDTLLGAEPLPGAKVRLECRNTKYPLRINGITNDRGYFLIRPKTVTTYAAHKCKVTLLASNSTTCVVPTDLHGGLKGSLLRPEKTDLSKPPLPFVLFTVGPFAYESAKSVKCH